MEIEKAIDIMKYNKELLGLSEQGNKWRENANTIACDLAIKALEKQKPTLVEWSAAYQSYFSVGDEAEAYCAICGEKLEEEQKYCKECGQKLDWNTQTDK